MRQPVATPVILEAARNQLAIKCALLHSASICASLVRMRMDSIRTYNMHSLIAAACMTRETFLTPLADREPGGRRRGASDARPNSLHRRG